MCGKVTFSRKNNDLIRSETGNILNMLLLVRNGLKQKLKKQNSFGTSPLIDPSMDFSTFDMDQLGKIRPGAGVGVYIVS